MIGPLIQISCSITVHPEILVAIMLAMIALTVFWKTVAREFDDSLGWEVLSRQLGF